MSTHNTSLPTVNFPTEYEALRRIVKLVDNPWYKTLNPTNQEQEIQEFRKRLDTLAGKVMECGTVAFSQIRLRQEINQREAVHTPSLYLTVNPPAFSKAPVNQQITLQLPKKETDFYVLFAGKLSHIKISPDDTSMLMLILNKDDINKIWDVTVSRLQEMGKTEWNNSFVVMSHSWSHIIEIPTPKETDEKKK